MSVIRNVRDIDSDDRRALEHVLGRSLKDHEQIVLDVVERSEKMSSGSASHEDALSLPDWCDIYAGMSDSEVAVIEEAIVRSSGSRRVD